MDPRDIHAAPREPAPGQVAEQDLDRLLALVARGDEAAFEAVYDRLAGAPYGLIRKVVRDPAQSEEVAQEVLLEVWRTASRFDPAKGTAATWVMTIAHRRAVDRSGRRRPRQRAISRPRRHRRPTTRWPTRWRPASPVSGCGTAWGA